MEYQEKQNNNSEMNLFEDGRFSFWEGYVGGKTVVIRARDDDYPASRSIEKGLPRGIALYPAHPEHIKKWLDSHPDYKLLEP